jgi:hypothetical protein
VPACLVGCPAVAVTGVPSSSHSIETRPSASPQGSFTATPFRAFAQSPKPKPMEEK